MSVIDTIEQAMRRNLEANAPPLSGTPIAEADHADLLDGVLDASALTLADARVERDGDAVLVHGRADLFGRSSLDVALGFEGLGDDGCAFLLRASLSDLPALAALAASIETPQLWWSIGPLGGDIRRHLPAGDLRRSLDNDPQDR